MAKSKPKTKTMLIEPTSLKNPLHYMRYMRKDHGETVQQIARSEGVTTRAIEKSIRQIELHRSVYSMQNLNTSLTGMLMSNVDNVDKTMRRMFEAKEYVEQKLPTGEVEFIPVDDKTIQLEAVKVYGKLLESMQPKGGGMTVKVQQNNANQAVATSGKVGGYEEMLHSILKNVDNYNQLPSQTGDVIEAEAEDSNEDEEEVIQA